MSKQAIILFGPPGAGKGAQSELISNKIGAYIFETSGIIGRKIAEAKSGDFIEADGEKFYFEKEKEIMEHGKLWDPPFVVHFVIEKIKELAEEGENVIFSGSPRTIYEVEKIVPLLEKLYGKENIKVVLLDIKAEETIFRNSHRKRCELMRHSIIFNNETEKLSLCPLDGSKLVTRADDDAEAIRVRINEYTERTLPMLDYFKKNNFIVSTVNGAQSVADVFRDILKAVEEKK